MIKNKMIEYLRYKMNKSAKLCIFAFLFTIILVISMILLKDNNLLIVLVSILQFDLAILISLKEGVDLRYCFIIQCICFGLLYGALNPMFCVSDERTHFMTGYHFANEMLGVHDELYDDSYPGARWYHLNIRDIDQIYFRDDYESISYINNLSDEMLFKKSDGYVTIDSQFTTQYFPVPSYILMGLTIALGRIINLSPWWLAWMTRFVNLIVYAIIGSMSIKLIPFGKQMIYTMLLFPLGLYFSCSASYHCMLYATAILYVAYMCYIQNLEKIRIVDKILVVVFSILIVPAKSCFLFYSFLVLLTREEQFESKKERRVFIGVTLAASIIVWFLYSAYTVNLLKLVSDSHGARIIEYMDAGEGIYLSDIFQNPLHYIKILFDSVISYGFSIESSLVNVRYNLGGLCTFLCLFALFRYSFFNDSEVYFKNPGKAKAIVGSIYILSYVLMSFIVLFQWGARDWTTVGLKGAYVFQFLPLLGLTLMYGKSTLLKTNAAQRNMVVLVVLMNMSGIITALPQLF